MRKRKRPAYESILSLMGQEPEPEKPKLDAGPKPGDKLTVIQAHKLEMMDRRPSEELKHTIRLYLREMLEGTVQAAMTEDGRADFTLTAKGDRRLVKAANASQK